MTSAGAGGPDSRPAHWFPLVLFGALIALALPLYELPFAAGSPPTGWVAYAPLTRSSFWSFSSGSGAYGSSFFVMFHPSRGVAGVPEGWYWAAALLAGFLLTAWWYRRAARRGGPRGPGARYLAAGLILTAAATVLPLLLAPQASFPASLWLADVWSEGTLALLVIALGLGLLAWRARSRLLAAAALAFSAAAVLADWPAYRSAWPALAYRGSNPIAAVTLVAGRPSGQLADLLPAGVLLAAGLAVLLARRRCQA